MTVSADGSSRSASAARRSLRACRVTVCPWRVRMAPAMRPRPSADPVMSTRAMMVPFLRRLGAEVSAGGVHQFKGLRGVVAGELAVALDDVASDDDGFHVVGSGAE